jgi:hypothetical protein
LLAAGLVLGAASLAAIPPAAAAPMMPNQVNGATTAETVQFRHHGGWRHGGWHRGYGHGGYRYGHRGYGYGYGPALGGLAAGAIIGGAIANSRAQAGDAEAYCVQRFKSYDPASGTYLGYDGQRHACP